MLMAQAVPKGAPAATVATPQRNKSSQAIVRTLSANEFIFGVVGPVGAGTSEIAEALKALMEARGFETTVLKARHAIREWAAGQGRAGPEDGELNEAEWLQDLGDKMRAAGDQAAVARALIRQIRSERARQTKQELVEGAPIVPDGRKRAYILDSLRHPQEVALLRQIYQEAFCLIGIVCYEEERYRRLHEKKYRGSGADSIEKFMKRDENAPEKFGQKVSDTFHLADFFVDNTVERFVARPGQAPTENPDWDVSEQLGRLVDLLTHARIVRPRTNETGMFHAHGARMRSSCLSRQVGAALLDKSGDVVATGSNEVPKAGGGLYGGGFPNGVSGDPHPEEDARCFVHNKYCSNTREQNAIVIDLLKNVEEFADVEPSNDLIGRILKSTRIGQLIEFSRAVHAEMDALLSAGRQGISTKATRLFVTTFPCHNCARHVVSAGVDEVQFIEPYLKSKTLDLHSDAVTKNPRNWTPPSEVQPAEHGNHRPLPKVLFRPFTGVAPRLYRRVFLKDRDLKNPLDGALHAEFGSPDGYGTWETLRVSYAEVEARLAGEDGAAVS